MKILRSLTRILGFAAKATLIIAGINMFFSYIEELKNRNLPEDGRFYVWRYGKVFYHKRGKGDPVILLHGFDPSHSGKDLESLSSHLAANHTVYRIDLPGFGLSDKPWITYTNYFYVLLLQNFVRDIIGDMTNIIACGGSGLSVLQANKMDDSMFGKIILIDPCYEEPLKAPARIAKPLRTLIDLPLIGTFIFNLFSLIGAAPFDKEGRHVFTSRLAGTLTSDITKHPELITPDVSIFSRDAEEDIFTFGDISSSLV